jgi:hypothetical protein
VAQCVGHQVAPPEIEQQKHDAHGKITWSKVCTPMVGLSPNTRREIATSDRGPPSATIKPATVGQIRSPRRLSPISV